MSLTEQRVGILRRCRRCGSLLSIDQFDPLGRLCKGCVNTRSIPTDRIAKMRAIVLTDKARAALKELTAA